MSRWHSFLLAGDTIDQIVQLEITAAQQATAASAHDSAANFLTCALALLRLAHANDKSDVPDEPRAQDISASDIGTQAHSDSSPSDVAATAALESESTSAPLTGDSDLSLDSSATAPVSDETADTFLQLPSSSWQRSFDTCALLYSDLARSFFLSSLYPAAEKCVEYALSHMRDVTDRSPLFELHVISISSQLRLSDALAVGLAHMKELGIEMVPDMSAELKEWIYSVHECDGIIQHPVFEQEEMTDSAALQATVLAGTLTPILYLRHSPLFSNNALTMLQLTKVSELCPSQFQDEKPCIEYSR